MAIPNPAVVTVRSDTGFERAATMEVVRAQVCGCDGHPTSSTGMLEPCPESRHTVSTNQQDELKQFSVLKHVCVSVWFGEVGLALP